MSCTRREFLSQVGSAVAIGALAKSPPVAAAASGTAAGTDLCFGSGRELARLIRERKLSARELMTAHLRQIARLNPKLNAIVAKLDDAKCLALADEADQQLARGARIGPLHGLPFAHKDTEPAVGFPFTRGSTIFRNDMPKADSVVVERLRLAGVITIGKTNVPEFAFGSHTYNKVYGTTTNPYDVTKSAGGSSGGAAAALAAGMLPLANGSDLGGSLRNPGNFNNVVGLRPTVGLVPMAPVGMPFVGMAVKGPLARSVADTAFLLSVMAGPDGRDPGCYPSDPTIFTRPLERSLKGVRVAWCPGLGALPLDPRVRAVLDAQRRTFEKLGCVVEEAAPDFSGVDEAFLTLRAWRTYSAYGDLLAKHRDEMKPEAVGEIEAGAKVTGTAVSKAMVRQAQIMERMRVFQERYQFVLCAVNQVPPFDATLDWPKEIAGTKMDNYIAWMKSAYWITMTSCPAISVPAGFTPEGLPVGIQIVGRYRGDFELLQMAHMFEQATNVGKKRPAIAV
jgi:amidase